MSSRQEIAIDTQASELLTRYPQVLAAVNTAVEPLDADEPSMMDLAAWPRGDRSRSDPTVAIDVPSGR